MKSQRTIVSFLLFLVFSAAEDGLKQLDEAELASKIASDGLLLVFFHSSWAATGLQKELQGLESEIPKLSLFQCDVYKNPGLSDKFGFKSLPQVRLFAKGSEIAVFEGLIRREYLKDWVLKRLDPLVKQAGGLDDVKAAIREHGLVVLIDAEGAEERGFIDRINRRFDSVFFVVGGDQEIKGKYTEKVTFFRGFAAESPITKGSLHGLQGFIDRFRFPSPTRLSHSVKDWALSTEDPILWLFTENDMKKEGETAEKTGEIAEKTTILAVFEAVSKSFQGEMAFIVEDGSFKDAMLENIVGKWEVNDERPCLRLTRGTKEAFEVFFFKEDEITEAEIRLFIEKIRLNQEKADIIAKKEETGVVSLDDRSFQEVVYSEDRDVIVLFSALNCDFCKKFEKVFERTAEKVKNELTSLDFAKVDINRYELFEFSIEEIPTVYLFLRGRKEQVIEFDGEEKISSLSEFLRKHVGNNNNNREEL